MKVGTFTFGQNMYKGPMPRFKYLGFMDKVAMILLLIPTAMLLGLVEYALWWERELYTEDEDASEAPRV